MITAMEATVYGTLCHAMGLLESEDYEDEETYHRLYVLLGGQRDQMVEDFWARLPTTS